MIVNIGTSASSIAHVLNAVQTSSQGWQQGDPWTGGGDSSASGGSAQQAGTASQGKPRPPQSPQPSEPPGDRTTPTTIATSATAAGLSKLGTIPEDTAITSGRELPSDFERKL
eukprot:9409265-Pyramimonas_sp.AAC.1